MRKLACGIAAITFAGAVWGQAWRPEKTVDFTVATGPIGNSDRITRAAQKVLQDYKLITTPMVVQNRTGGNQTKAAEILQIPVHAYRHLVAKHNLQDGEQK